MKSISKSRFISYLECPKNAWFDLHYPKLEELKVSDSLQLIFDQGYVVEEYTKQLFPDFIDVESKAKDFKDKLKISEKLVREKRVINKLKKQNNNER